jgi:hypothetical protein
MMLYTKGIFLLDFLQLHYYSNTMKRLQKYYHHIKAQSVWIQQESLKN